MLEKERKIASSVSSWGVLQDDEYEDRLGDLTPRYLWYKISCVINNNISSIKSQSIILQ